MKTHGLNFSPSVFSTISPSVPNHRFSFAPSTSLTTAHGVLFVLLEAAVALLPLLFVVAAACSLPNVGFIKSASTTLAMFFPPMNTTTVSTSAKSLNASGFVFASWPEIHAKCFPPRMVSVSGIPTAAALATKLETPGTISYFIFARFSASISFPSLPNIVGSPPFNRTTCLYLPLADNSTNKLLISACDVFFSALPPLLPTYIFLHFCPHRDKVSSLSTPKSS
mmetsp:Transcript_5211/g.16600  ORF Transcript_5211/g.16600 Transcript_5211/m.16600 type:complete len:224 (-) Transcript_5211:229-900(-)